MIYEDITLDGFSIIGVAIRTTNEGGMSQKDIRLLWDRFLGQNMIERIPNKSANDIYCVYTDYESDFMGAYTTILGCKVASLNQIPDGFIGKKMQRATYRHYKTQPENVGNVWTDIWRSGIERKYVADFDVYSSKAIDPATAEVDIYVS